MLYRAPMSSEDYQIQNVYRYARKSYKTSRSEAHENFVYSCQEEANSEAEHSARSPTVDSPVCNCPDHELASILHKKFPVISLARQQLQKVLADTDILINNNNRRCRSLYDFMYVCRELCMNQNKCTCVLIMFIAFAFFFGLIFGAASCGSYLGQFNSPILACLDNRFISEKYTTMEEYRGIT